jgi:DNA modification methylase
VEYDQEENPWSTYEAYLDDMQSVWTQCARVLRPNGKLCINAPIMPIPKAVIEQHTRHLKNIAFDTEHRILTQTDLERYSLFVWQKQTSKMMFGSYPHPGNIIENNTIEFINVYVKPGKPPKFDTDTKDANELTRTEWLDLAQQVSCCGAVVFRRAMILHRGRLGFKKDDGPDRVRHDIGIAASSRLGLGRARRIGSSGRHRMVVGQRTPSASPDT